MARGDGTSRETYAFLALAFVALVVLFSVAGPASGAVTTANIEAETMSLASNSGAKFSDRTASGGAALLLRSKATATKGVTTARADRLVVRARGDQCGGAPRMVVKVGGTQVLSKLVSATKWTDYPVSIAPVSGAQTVRVSFTNEHRTRSCDRNLRVDKVSFVSTAAPAPAPAPEQPAPAADPSPIVEAEALALPPGNGEVFSDGGASGGSALLVWSNAEASKQVTTPAAGGLVVRARGDQCEGAPLMVVKVDGKQVLSKEVPETGWTDHAAPVSLASGEHDVAVSFTNDHTATSCDRNLRVDKITFGATPATEPAPSPVTEADVFEGTKLYVDPNSNAKRQADAWHSSRPEDARQMDKIAVGADADWFGDWSGDIRAAVDARVTEITNAGALPVLVAYDIPNRDCSGQSAGGASSPEAYKAWIRAFAEGIEGRKVAVIVEPDAVALTSCLSEAEKATRYALLKDAVNVLEAQGNTATYVDAGHSSWVPASEMAARLTEAGIGPADGFSLNVSNFRATPEITSYGKDVSSRVGGDHFVIDTARNGLGPSPDNQWCNPPGRAIGEKPGANTADPSVDAYLWIKPPGESDGSCNGGPPAGQWWPEYALGLAQRAAY